MSSADFNPKIHRLPRLPEREPTPVRAPSVESSAKSGKSWIFLILFAMVATISIKAIRQETLPADAGAGEAQLAPAAGGSVPDSTLPGGLNKGTKTIMIQGKNEVIVGQLTKIPAQNEQITEVKSASEVDNNAGRELLSIISKY